MWLTEIIPIEIHLHSQQGKKVKLVSGAIQEAPHYREFNKSTNRKTVKIVCADCNNGWMSSLEDTALPILGPLIKGQITKVTQDQLKIIVRWSALRAIINEFTQIETLSIPIAVRDIVMKGLDLPSLWLTWIGWFDCKELSIRSHHTGARTYPIGTSREKINKMSYNAQSTTLVLGKLVFYMLYMQDEALLKRMVESPTPELENIYPLLPKDYTHIPLNPVNNNNIRNMTGFLSDIMKEKAHLATPS